LSRNLFETKENFHIPACFEMFDIKFQVIFSGFLKSLSKVIFLNAISLIRNTYLNTDNPNGTTSSTMVSSAIFKLEPNEQFTVFHKYVNQNNVAPISIGGTFDVHNNSITVFRIS
jgi:hypothetical protein